LIVSAKSSLKMVFFFKSRNFWIQLIKFVILDFEVLLTGYQTVMMKRHHSEKAVQKTSNLEACKDQSGVVSLNNLNYGYAKVSYFLIQFYS
jgi:hypothetical protein